MHPFFKSFNSNQHKKISLSSKFVENYSYKKVFVAKLFSFKNFGSILILVHCTKITLRLPFYCFVIVNSVFFLAFFLAYRNTIIEGLKHTYLPCTVPVFPPMYLLLLFVTGGECCFYGLYYVYTTNSDPTFFSFF